MPKSKHSQKIRFAAVGAINTGIDFGIFLSLGAAGFNTLIANYISTSVALTFSFYANRKYTFQGRNSQNIHKEICLFLIFTVIGLWLIQPAIIFVVERSLDSSALTHSIVLIVAKLMATSISLLWNYATYSRYVFKAEAES